MAHLYTTCAMIYQKKTNDDYKSPNYAKGLENEKKKKKRKRKKKERKKE